MHELVFDLYFIYSPINRRVTSKRRPKRIDTVAHIYRDPSRARRRLFGRTTVTTSRLVSKSTSLLYRIRGRPISFFFPRGRNCIPPPSFVATPFPKIVQFSLAELWKSRGKSKIQLYMPIYKFKTRKNRSVSATSFFCFLQNFIRIII